MYKSHERIKLDLKSRRCIFLSYADSVKGYHLLDPTNCKVIVNRDVIFTEGELKNKDDNTPKDTTTVHINVDSGKDDSSGTRTRKSR